MNIRTAASVEKLETIKDVTRADARAIRKAWKEENLKRGPAREKIDGILQTFGIEYLGIYKPSGDHVYYANTGDAYATTVVFIGHRLIVACWADMVEKNLIREI